MTSGFNLRSFFGLCLVLMLHSAIFSLLFTKNTFLAKGGPEARSLHYVSIIEPKSLRTLSSKPKTGRVSKANTANRSANSFTSTFPLTIVPATTITDTPINDLPRLDLNTLRASVVQYELNRTRSPTELQEEKNRRYHSLEARVERGADKAQRSDCRTRYAHNGLFAALFIAADALNDEGCKF